MVRINSPMVIVNVLASLYFIFCLTRPSRGERLKQPLKLLLWTVICSTLSFLVTLLVLFGSEPDSFETNMATFGMFLLSLSISMNASVWLNFYYYMQIVPSKSGAFVWIKRNLKPIIYCIWVVEKLINGLIVSSILTFKISIINYLNDFELPNSTSTSYAIFLTSHLRFSVIATQIYILICLCVMLASSWCTVVYLSRHTCQMASQGLSCSRFRSQVRVTASGILQGALYLMVSLCVVAENLCFNVLATHGSYLALSNITMINVYMMGTSVSLGVGQTVFRQRAVDLWHRAVRSCKTIKPQ